MATRPRAWIGVLSVLLLMTAAAAQDSSTAALRGSVSDAAGARIAGAEVIATQVSTGTAHRTITDTEGVFTLQLLPPGEYRVRVEAPGMAAKVLTGVGLELGATATLEIALAVAPRQEEITVEAPVPLVDTHASGVSSVIAQREIADLPLNGRRFSDLALLTPGVTQDPRGYTSSTNGDLAYGGVRGLSTNYLVDGSDNNNSFFAQARGRYRAPYQFSNETVQEFRVSSNTYDPELGRSAGAVVNVITKSGGNYTHGSVFYYLRDSAFNAENPFVGFKPADRQQQFGGTIGGRLRRNRMFYFAGFDQHVYHVPTVVRFLNGSDTVTPTPADYEARDRALVESAAQDLSAMGGEFRSAMVGNAVFAKLDVNLSPRHFLSVRANVSRYAGQNNVFLDPTSPVTYYAVSDNGEERVRTETVSTALTSALTFRLNSKFRAQFSRDLQASRANSADPLVRVADVIEGFGRSSILPRRTREHRLHLAETLTRGGDRHTWKFGGDYLKTWNYNFFPSLFGGEYIFDNVKVNPFTFQPWRYGLALTPLRAYAHGVPRYYIQNFGSAVSHPDGADWSLFAQDTIRVNEHLGLTLGVRYDRQTFREDHLEPNPLVPGSGRVPHDGNNLAPRVGLAYALGHERPLVVRAGFGMFYARVPQMYASQVELENGLGQSHLFLDVVNQVHALSFPAYPAPLVACGVEATSCPAPASVQPFLETEVSMFAPDFQTPYTQQASLTVEKEIRERFAAGVAYLYVKGRHLIRARDINLPPPVELTYPVFDQSGSDFLGEYYTVASFANWQTTRSLDCPFPPCRNDVQRPMPEFGAVNTFESAATSTYHGLTVSLRRRMTGGLYFRLSYTWAKAIDDLQDALVAGRPVSVQNTYAPAERALSVTDQRQRIAVSWVWEPAFFHADRPLARALLNHWRLAGVTTAGSGRPVNARITGDANGDNNLYNDRLPGASRNNLTGPNYFTLNLRLARSFYLTQRFRMEALAESFNLLNRRNLRVDTSDDGYLNTAGDFVPWDVQADTTRYPAHFRLTTAGLRPTSAYAPRQVQFSLRLRF